MPASAAWSAPANSHPPSPTRTPVKHHPKPLILFKPPRRQERQVSPASLWERPPAAIVRSGVFPIAPYLGGALGLGGYDDRGRRPLEPRLTAVCLKPLEPRLAAVCLKPLPQARCCCRVGTRIPVCCATALRRFGGVAPPIKRAAKFSGETPEGPVAGETPALQCCSAGVPASRRSDDACCTTAPRLTETSPSQP